MTTSIADDVIDIKKLADRIEADSRQKLADHIKADSRRTENIFGDLVLCEKCGTFLDSGYDTESYFEDHGHNGSERLSRTSCCRASYTDVDGQAIIDELKRIQMLTIPIGEMILKAAVSAKSGGGSNVDMLDQITRDNIDAIIPVLETVFDL